MARVGDRLRGIHPSAYDPVPALNYGAAGARGWEDDRLGSTSCDQPMWVLGRLADDAAYVLGRHLSGPRMRIELRDISLTYPGGSTVFQDVGLVVEPGEFLIIQGASGTGKSSLLRLMNRLHEPTGGDIRIDGEPIADLDVTELRRRMGYVQQTPAMIEGSVEENLALSFRFRSSKTRRPPTSDELRGRMAEFLLEHVNITDDADPLSVGEKQRVALIRALLTGPEVLLCDEPTSALDADSRRIVEGALERLNAEEGMTVVLVTHLDLGVSCGAPRRLRLSRSDGLTEVSA